MEKGEQKMRKNRILGLAVLTFILISACLLFSSIKPAQAAGLGLDTNSNSHKIAIGAASTTSLQLSIQTDSGNDVIYASAYTINTGNTLTISSTHHPSADWHSRGTVIYTSGYGKMQCWYLVSTSPLTTAELITFTSSGSSGGMVVIAYSVSGANTASPFETTQAGSNNGNGGTPSASMTATTGDFVVGLMAKNGNSVLTAGTGYTLGDTTNQGTPSSAGEVEYRAITSTGPAAPSFASSTVYWIMMAEAFVPTSVSVTFAVPGGMTSDASGTVLTIDSTPYAYSALPHTFNWLSGSTHTVTASSPVSAGTGKQYVFGAWSDPTDFSGTTFTTPASTTTVTATYNTQYALTVASAYGSPSPAVGTNWVTAGSTSASVTSPVTVGSISYTCGGWTGSGSVPASGSTASTGAFSISQPSSITWNWAPTSIAVTFAVPGGMTSDASGTVLTIDGTAYAYSALPHTFNWPSGSAKTVTASSPVSAGDWKQYVFASWSSPNGGLSGVGPSTFTVPTSAITVTATYTTQYEVIFDASANVKGDSSATIVTVAGQAKSSSTLPFTTGWITSGGTVTWSYSSPVASTASPSGTRYSWASTSGLSQTTQSGTLTVTTFGTVTATYNAQYALSVTSAYGSPSPAVGTNWITAGSTTASVTSPVTSGAVSYTCIGWSGTGSVASSGSAATTTFTISQPSTITWNWAPTVLAISFRTSGMTTDTGSATVLTIDGTGYTYAALQTLNLNLASGSGHSVTASSPVSGGSGKQYVFSSWTNANGLSGVGPSTFTTPASATTVTATYSVQYQLTVASGHGGPVPAVGTSWQAAGSMTASVSSPVTEGGVIYDCTGWTGTGSVATSGTTITTTFTLGALSSITWNWQARAVPITLNTNGLTSDSQGNVLSIDGTPYTYSQLLTPQTPTLDGKGANSATSGTTFTVPLTTTKSNEVLYLAVISRTSYVSSVSDSNSLTWTCRQTSGSTITWSSGTARYVSSWYAKQPIAGATTITIHLSASTTGASAVAFSVNGVNWNTPFDGNSIYAKDTSAGTSATVNIVTTNANDFIIGAVATRSTSNTPTVGSGFTQIQAASNTVSNPNGVSTEYKAVSTTQLSPGLAVGYTLSASDDWAMIADAMQASQSSTPTITFNWIPGSTHTISGADPISAGIGKQYRFGSWSDPTDFSGVSGTTFTVPISSTTAIVSYNTQYQLTVTSAYGSTIGAGWYNSGATPTVGVNAGTVSGGSGTQYTFTSWGTDASGTTYSASNTITMSGPKTATATWQTQYQLTVNDGGHGSAGGANWYNSGATAHATMTPLTVAGATGTQYVFNGWTNDASGLGSPSAGITMSGPKTATATWQSQYQVSFTVNPDATGSITPTSSKWYNAGSTANSISASSNTGYDFKSWSTSDPITFADSTQSSTTMTINGPGTATANFQEQIHVLSTSLTISCTPASVNPSGQTILTGKLTLSSDHDTGVEGKTITLAYFDSANKWETIGTATTGSDGTYTEHWTIPSDLEKGFHIVQATFAADTTGNPQYLGQTAATGSDGEGIFVLPEYLFGTIAALGACFAALIIFKKRGSLPNFKRR
jgi:uncharacterized repeat protein (TIGR02543 family)